MQVGNIKVSVVMAACNAEKYIREALGSVVNQTLRDIEILLINDLSTDGTLAIMEEFAARDSRIRILQHMKKTEDAAAARNMGVEAAQGDYLSILDADDWFAPDMLEKAYRTATETDADEVIFDAWRFCEDIGKWMPGIARREFIPKPLQTGKVSVFSPQSCGKNLFMMKTGAAWNSLYRTRFIKENGIRFLSGYHMQDDVAFSMLSHALATRIAFLPECLMQYRIHPEGQWITSYKGRFPEFSYAISQTLKKELTRRGIYQKYWQPLMNLAMQTANVELNLAISYDVFVSMHDGVRDVLTSMNADKLLPSQFSRPEMVAWRDILMHGTALDLIDEWYLPRKLGKEAQNLLTGFPWGSRVAIYGAGDRGKQAFQWLFCFQWCQITNWVDQNFNRLGFPVRDPESLRAGGFDCVLVAIERKETYQAIRKYLMNMGISEGQIIWMFHWS